MYRPDFRERINHIVAAKNRVLHNLDPAAGDYRLAQGSPGIDAGGSVEVPRRDRAGNARFDDPAAPDRGGSIVDIGGYEYRPDARLGPVATGGASG